MLEGAHCLLALLGRKDESEEALTGAILVVRYMAKVEALVDAFKSK